MIAKIYLSLGILEVIQKYQKTTQNTKNKIGNRIVVCLFFMLQRSLKLAVRHIKKKEIDVKNENGKDLVSDLNIVVDIVMVSNLITNMFVITNVDLLNNSLCIKCQ